MDRRHRISTDSRAPQKRADLSPLLSGRRFDCNAHGLPSTATSFLVKRLSPDPGQFL